MEFSSNFNRLVLDLLPYIADLLFQQKVCELPGIGRFRLQYFPALSEQDHSLIYPPRVEIRFEELTEEPPLYLIRYLAQRENISEPQANAAFEKCILRLKLRLAEGEQLEIPAVGTLQRDSEGKTIFKAQTDRFRIWEPVQAVLLASEKAGIPENPAPETLLQPESPWRAALQRTENTRSRKRWWILAMLVLAVLIGMVLGLKECALSQGSSPVQHQAVLPAEMSPKPAPVTDSVIKQPAAVDTLKPSAETRADSIHYNIVFASFSDPAKAEKKYLKIKHWGHPIVLLRAPEEGVYRLAIPFYSPGSDTLENLKYVKKTYGNSAYLFH